jgi:hypothetical protein
MSYNLSMCISFIVFLIQVVVGLVPILLVISCVYHTGASENDVIRPPSLSKFDRENHET